MLCITCKEDKDFSLFNKSSRSKTGYQNHCRDCSKLYYKNNSVKHIENVRKSNTLYLEEIQAFLWEYLLHHPCEFCNESDPIVLDFDHYKGDKTLTISEMMRRKYSVPAIQEEIKKCRVLCANCHRRRTAEQFGTWRWVRQG